MKSQRDLLDLSILYDTARGSVDSDHWLLDLPGVYLPAVLLAAAAFHFRERSASAGSRTRAAT